MNKDLYNAYFPTIIVPRGGGSHFLKSLVYSIEYNEIIKNDNIYYDYNSYQTRSIGCIHLLDDKTNCITLAAKNADAICISKNKSLYNHYAIAMDKVIISGLDGDFELYSEFTPKAQLNIAINFAKSWLIGNNQKYYEYINSNKNIKVIDYDLIFTDVDAFILEIYNFLDCYDVKFYRNDDIMKFMIQEYVNTTSNAFKSYYDYNNILWIGWCIALIDKFDIVINDDISDIDSIEEIIPYIHSYEDFIIEESRKYMINVE